MAVSIPELKKAAAIISDQKKLSASEGLRIVSALRGDAAAVAAILAGDLSKIPDFSTAGGIAEKRTHADGGRIVTDTNGAHGLAITSKDIQQTNNNIINNNAVVGLSDDINGDIIPTMDGDILPAEKSALPAGFSDTVAGWLDEFKLKAGFDDLSKIAGLQWRAACLYVGERIKAGRFLYDLERLKTHGGSIIYNPHAVADLVSIWEAMTALYKHVPLAGDFIAFAGVSQEWFYDTRGRLTSSRVEIAKKVRDIEEKALAAALCDSRENPTGRIYYTKARLGWRESTEIIHTSAKETHAGGALPVFDGSAGFLTDNTL